MALTLRLRSGDVDPEPELPFDAPRIVVGRAPGCDLQLPDPSVSGRHASIRQRGSDHVVVDEGSDNGTYLGATRLARHAPHTLRDGDLLRFGRVWVEVRLGPAERAIEPQASRELARRLVETALAADEAPYGMTVSAEGNERSLRLVEPRRAYVVGTKRGADLRLVATDLPGRCLELRRQADQLWVTLQKGASATLGERNLVEGERCAWPKGALLALGDVRLSATDPTAQMLERLEREPTERLADDAPIEPPSGMPNAPGHASDEEDEEDEDAPGDLEDADDGGALDDDEDELAAAPARPGSRAPAPPRSGEVGGGWSRADAIIFLLAISVLALSLWAIRWLAQVGSA